MVCTIDTLMMDRFYFSVQTRTAVLLAAATRFPSRLSAIDVISSGAPRSVLTTFPLVLFQMRTDRCRAIIGVPITDRGKPIGALFG